MITALLRLLPLLGKANTTPVLHKQCTVCTYNINQFTPPPSIRTYILQSCKLYTYKYVLQHTDDCRALVAHGALSHLSLGLQKRADLPGLVHQTHFPSCITTHTVCIVANANEKGTEEDTHLKAVPLLPVKNQCRGGEGGGLVWGERKSGREFGSGVNTHLYLYLYTHVHARTATHTHTHMHARTHTHTPR